MENTARYIFVGTPRFAAIILEKLIDAGMPPVALVCNPDRPVGRKQVITPPPTKQLMANRKAQIEILQPDHVLTIRDKLLAIRPDLFIVAAYAKILPKEILAIPRLGTIGVHPSLLPKFRGPSPIQSAILAGEAETGVTLFLMDEKLDHGPIIAEQKITIDNLFAYSRELADELAEVSAELLIETMPKFAKSEITAVPQDESQATYTKKFTSEDAFVSEEDLRAATSGNSPEKATEISRKIRALNPEPGVFTMSMSPLDSARGDPEFVEGSKGGPRRVKLLEAKLEEGNLVLKKIQEAGKKPTLPNFPI